MLQKKRKLRVLFAIDSLIGLLFLGECSRKEAIAIEGKCKNRGQLSRRLSKVDLKGTVFLKLFAELFVFLLPEGFIPNYVGNIEDE